MVGRKVVAGAAVPVTAPRVGDALVAFAGDGVEDGDVIDGVLWVGDGDADGSSGAEGGGGPALPDGVRDLSVVASRLRGLRLTGVELEEPTLVDTAVERCELSGAVLSGARAERVAFTDCRMAGLVAADLRARHVRFSGCQLTGAWLRGASFELCELVDCDLTGANLDGARFVTCRLVGCRLDGADLTGLDAQELALHGTSLDGAKGLAGLQNLVIGSDQVLELAVPLLAARGIRVDDDYLAALDDPEPPPA